MGDFTNPLTTPANGQSSSVHADIVARADKEDIWIVQVTDTIIPPLDKLPTGINGFDEIAHGGIPKGRTTLISGTSGSGKTIFSMQFLVAGINSYGENGVFVTFEEI